MFLFLSFSIYLGAGRKKNYSEKCSFTAIHSPIQFQFILTMELNRLLCNFRKGKSQQIAERNKKKTTTTMKLVIFDFLASVQLICSIILTPNRYTPVCPNEIDCNFSGKKMECIFRMIPTNRYNFVYSRSDNVKWICVMD